MNDMKHGVNIFKKISSVSGWFYVLMLTTIVIPFKTSANGMSTLLSDCASRSAGDVQCGWDELIWLVNYTVQFIVLTILPLGIVIAVTYAGYLYLTSDGAESKIKQAHDVITKTVVGVAVTLCCWLIVYSIVTWLGVDSQFTQIIK